MITDFAEKKLAEYLHPQQRVLIRFGHGLGDTIMFFPALDELRRQFPDTHIALYVESGQEELWGQERDKDADGYDLVFSLDFPMSEGTDVTKVGKCCIEELGIAPVAGLAALPDCDSPLVAVHFQGTALPGSVGCPDAIAAQVWAEVLSAGKMPLEAHFEHVFHNPANTKPACVTASMRQCQPRVSSLIGLLQRCYAFIGVASGPFVVAASVMPDRCFYLENEHPLETYTDLDIPRADVNDYEEGSVLAWLTSLAG